jgi:hypothetical protein
MPSRLTLVTQSGCGLCEEMHAQLQRLARTQPLPPLVLADVEEDAALARDYGWDIPVLLLDGAVVCKHHLDEAALLSRLRGARGEDAAS